MASAAALVNQRLYSCRIQLQHYAEAINAASIPSNTLEQCYGGACILHLYLSYISYLQELVAQYKINSPVIENAQQVKAIMAEQGNFSLEISELADLEQADTWLAALITAYEAFVNTQPQAVKSAKPQANSIQLHVVDDVTDISLQACEKKYTALSELIQRHRDLYQEY